ncbi:hypothetical protein ACOMHN_026839 [Nucella lapillus]
MENYTKKEVKEIDDPYPFSVDEALQMRITQGSKIRNVMGFAMKKMGDKEVRQIAWNGSGLSVTKTITCAEIMKRRLKNLHQITKIRYKRIEEHWVPTVEGPEPLKVNRDMPAISILLSKDPLDAAEPGYRPPGSFDALWKDKARQADSRSAGRQRQRPRPHTKFRGPPQDYQKGGGRHHRQQQQQQHHTTPRPMKAPSSSPRPTDNDIGES